MGPVKRLRLQVNERRKRIIAVATELFSTHPYDEIGIEDIAKQAGMSKGLLYHYFPTKHDLYLDMLRDVTREIQEKTQVDDSIPAGERLHASLLSLFSLVESHRSLYISLFYSGIGTDVEARAIVDQFMNMITSRTLQDFDIKNNIPLWSLLTHGWVSLLIDVVGQWVTASQKEQLDKDTIIKVVESAFYGMILQNSP